MKLGFEFRQRCEKIAAEQRRLLDLAPHVPLRAQTLAEKHAVSVCEPRDMPGASPEAAAFLASLADWDAVLLPALPGGGAIILVRPGMSPGRRQSTIMHEIAHLLLRHAPLAWDASSAQWEARRKGDEAEAAYLGGCLQIPHAGLKWAAQIGLSVARTASHFGASEKMVLYRSNIKGIRLSR